MVVELGSGVRSHVAHDEASSGCHAPGLYTVVVRIDDRRDVEAVTHLLEKAFGDGAGLTSRAGGRISARIWIEVGSFPREIAEARAAAVRRGARIGGIEVGVLIKKAG